MLTNIQTQENIIQVKPITKEEQVQTKNDNGDIVVSLLPQTQEWYELEKPENGFTHVLSKLFNVEGIKDGENTLYFLDKMNVLAYATYAEDTSDIEA